MEKISYYFSHDSNAHADPKCSALIKDFGMNGYGIYWLIVEVLHEQGGSLEKFPKLLSGLSYQFMVDEATLSKVIKALILDYNLLKEDDNFIWSDRVKRNLQGMRDKYEAKARAGHIGGIKSGQSRRVKRVEVPLQADELKESKENKSKECVPKSIEQVIEFMKDPIQANKFYNHFSSNGWKVGGRSAMKDWKASARNWMLNAHQYEQQPRPMKVTGV